MKKPLQRLPTSNRNTALRFERNQKALVRLALYTLCGMVLAGGFFFAAWQQVAAIKYGYGMEKLRSQRAQLEADRQRLQLIRERAVSLSQLEANPMAAGLQAMTGSQIEVAQKKRPATFQQILTERR